MVTDPQTGHDLRAADASVLQDQTPAWARMRRSSCVLVIALGITFLWFSVQPLYHSDLWAHLKYGEFIVANGGRTD